MNTLKLRWNAFRWHKVAWLVPVVLVLLAALIVWVAPEERSLGEGIKVVYVHVALIWAGLTGLAITGMIGVVLLVTDSVRLRGLAVTVSWVALAMFAAGLTMSLIAAQVNWGGFDLADPGNRAPMNILALGFIALVVVHWLPWTRARGLTYMLLVTLTVLVIPNRPMILHPQDAITLSSAENIRATFLVLFGIALLFSTWIVWFLEQNRSAAPDNPDANDSLQNSQPSQA